MQVALEELLVYLSLEVILCRCIRIERNRFSVLLPDPWREIDESSCFTRLSSQLLGCDGGEESGVLLRDGDRPAGPRVVTSVYLLPNS